MVTSGKAGIYRPTAPPVRPKVLTLDGLVLIHRNLRLRRGLIAEEWICSDMATLFRQLS